MLPWMVLFVLVCFWPVYVYARAHVRVASKVNDEVGVAVYVLY